MASIGAIILAAGMSRRMGFPKLLADFNGKPLFRYAVETAVQSALQPIVLVGGERVNALRQLTCDLPMVQVIDNPEYSKGMASSLKLGIAKVTGRVDGAMIFLADQPLVPGEVISELIKQYKSARNQGIQIIRPNYNGMLGHPVLFDSRLFKAFHQINGDEGGRSIVSNHNDKLLIVNFKNPYWGADVDTPEDLVKLKNIRP
ncbi:molybdenum cofactor cytidylyltransferase [Scopulibacillus daqui]|uniref:Molybdenum cofactor cytidylyltransferase n=1 Tax=Scopulibacillus daqui TaxID=1469162 RepID=A0ABS2PX98_9BACL|nr:nucleotidyltransferase family protein [Scopulibacillus daqui]MBM7644104.1 molybdenum cofactor cytidylyltransferase [Scopulibacillus daqui]